MDFEPAVGADRDSAGKARRQPEFDQTCRPGVEPGRRKAQGVSDLGHRCGQEGRECVSRGIADGCREADDVDVRRRPLDHAEQEQAAASDHEYADALAPLLQERTKRGQGLVESVASQHRSRV